MVEDPIAAVGQQPPEKEKNWSDSSEEEVSSSEEEEEEEDDSSVSSGVEDQEVEDYSLNLPGGWRKRYVMRKTEDRAGKWKAYLTSPEGERLRSRKDLEEWLRRGNLLHENFYWNLDRSVVNFSVRRRPSPYRCGKYFVTRTVHPPSKELQKVDRRLRRRARKEKQEKKRKEKKEEKKRKNKK
jgi:hypothetical protein